MKYILFSSMVLFFSTIFSQTAVTWENFKNTSVSGATLSKGSGIKGQASSRNMLHGSYDEVYFNGSFSFTNSGSSNQLKTIGFSVVESADAGFELIEYGFSFSNNTVKAYGKDNSYETAIASNQSFKLERQNDNMLFYINNTVVYQELIDISEYLVIRAQLKSNGATFAGVTASFDGLRPIIDPTITTSTKTIDLNSGTTFPLIQWEDGEKSMSSKKFISHTYKVDLYDAQTRKNTRSFAVGDDVIWQNLSGVNVSGATIEKTSGNNWGTATSQTTFANTETFWTETAYLSQTESKAFGFALSSANLQNTSNLEAGFVINKDYQIQVIHKGATIKTLEAYDKDRLNISYENGQITWSINGTIAFQTQSAFSSNVKAVALLKNGTQFSQVLEAKETPHFTTTWDETTELGTITVDLAGISGISGPYHYLIGDNDYVDPFDEMYRLIRDSIYHGDLDSAAFYLGNVSASSYTFISVPLSSYHVSVFNSLGQRILGQFVTLNAPLHLLFTDGVSIVNGNLKSSKDNAKAEMNIFLDPTQEIASLGFIVNDKSTNHAIGFIEAEQDISALSTITHGFAVHNGKIKTVKNGVESTTSYPVKKQSTLLIEKQNQDLVLKINGKERDRITLSSEQQLRGAVLVEKTNKEIVPAKEQQVAKQPSNYSISTELGNCANKFGKISFSLFDHVGSYSYVLSSIQVMNINITPNQAITADAGSSGNIYTYSNLQPNEYEITFTYVTQKMVSGNLVSISTNTVIEKVTIGFPMDWTNFSNSVYLQNNESINNTTPYNNFSLGYATSDKESEKLYEQNETYWVEFQVYLKLPQAEIINGVGGPEGPGGSHGGTFMLPRISYNDMESTVDATIGAPDPLRTISFIRNENTFTYRLPDGTSTSYFPAQKFRLEFYANHEFKFYVNGVEEYVGTLSGTEPVKLINAFMENAENNFYNVYTNLPCKVYDQYAQLKYELDGYYHVMKNGKIQFEYNQEYDATNLKFTLYNSVDKKLRDQSDFPAVPVTFGKNYITLNVATDDCIGKGFFYLEFINDKKEKLYLRFYNDYNLCIPEDNEEREE